LRGFYLQNLVGNNEIYSPQLKTLVNKWQTHTTQLYFHIVFAVKGHISSKWKNDLYKYITGIISAKEQKLMVIDGIPNHIHMLMAPSQHVICRI
jgi:REP element-mobilizing transposase RayT